VKLKSLNYLRDKNKHRNYRNYLFLNLFIIKKKNNIMYNHIDKLILNSLIGIVIENSIRSVCENILHSENDY